MKLKKELSALLVVIVLSGGLQSCIPTYTYTSVDPLIPKFVSVEKIFELAPGVSYESAVATLGQKPYNVLSSQANGYTGYKYYYRFVEREISEKKASQIGNENDGDEMYRSSTQALYLFFKGGKLEAFITTEGLSDGINMIMINNAFFKVTKESGEFILLPATEKEVEEYEENELAPLLKSLTK